MSTEVVTQNPVVWKKSAMLFGFQVAAACIVSGVLFLFTNVMNILTPSASSSFSSLIPPIIFGSYWFGYWQEKRNPGLLTPDLIKHICFKLVWWMVMSVVVIGFLYFIGKLIIGSSVDGELLFFIIIFMGFSVGIGSVFYWMTKFSIKRGVTQYQKKRALKEFQAKA